MEFVSPLSRSSSIMSYNGSSLSDAGNKATPSSSTSRHVHRDKGQLVAAFPVLKLEADIQNREGGAGEGEGKKTLQDDSDALLSPTFSTCNRKHGYSASCASAQPVAKLARAGTFSGFSSKHGIEESSLPPNCLLPLQDGTASSNCNDNGHISSSFVLRSSDIVGDTENAGFRFYGDCSHLPFLTSMDRNKSKTSIHGPIVSPQPTLITSLSGAAPNNVFSARQLNEFTQQVYIFKYLAAGMNPPAVLFPLIVSRRVGLPQISSSVGGFGFSRGAIDPEPGRCRRTDGKKWRCSRDAVPDQKYCERHMNRGRNRSKTKNNAGDAAMVTVNSSALTIGANPSSKCVVPTVKLAKSTSFGGESGLQFSLETPCRTPLEDMNKSLLCVDAASIYTLSEMTSSSCMPLSASKIQMTHNLFNRSTPSTMSVEDTKPLDAEPLMRSTPLPFQCLTGRSADKSSHLEFRNWQSTKRPSPCYEDARRIKCLSGTDLLIQNRSAAKFDVEEEFLEKERVPNWLPISWEATPSLTGGPLMEVVRPNGKEGSVGGGHHHHKLGSPTEVLHRVPFVSCSDSSSSASSPRSSALRTDCCLVGLCDVL